METLSEYSAVLSSEQMRFLERLDTDCGNIEKVARRLRMPLYIPLSWLEHDASYKEAYELVIDTVKERLIMKSRDGNTPATITYLRTFCKHRGYF